MDLFIGVSVITLLELLDLVIVNAILKYVFHRKSATRLSHIDYMTESDISGKWGKSFLKHGKFTLNVELKVRN